MGATDTIVTSMFEMLSSKNWVYQEIESKEYEALIEGRNIVLR